LRWRQPRRIFVNSMSDLFHEDVPDEFIDQVFAVMALCPQHTFQVLTKRAQRMRGYMTASSRPAALDVALGWAVGVANRSRKCVVQPNAPGGVEDWPLPNVWLGVSVENQQYADERIPLLLQTPAAVRFLSVEPMLGPVDLTQWTSGCRSAEGHEDCVACSQGKRLDGLDWVIVGGESGAGARPMHPDWARSIRDQCTAAGVPFFFKQWGEWQDGSKLPNWTGEIVLNDGRHGPSPEALGFGQGGKYSLMEWGPAHPTTMARVGKKAAGRLLDGREWNELPAVEVRA
jgi:protein gp37